MPLSKKRKKKTRNKPSGPPVSKVELSSKKRKITRQQILIYVFSALIIGSLAISFLIGGLGGGPVPPADSASDQSGVIVSPEAGGQDAEDGNITAEEAPAEE